MRWDNLFDDLESQLEHELAVDEIDVRAETERLRLGRLGIRDRLIEMTRFASGSERATIGGVTSGDEVIRVVLQGERALGVRPDVFGRDWLAGELIDGSHRKSQCVLPLASIVSILPTAGQLESSVNQSPAPPAAGRLTDRLGIAFVLRDLCRRRAAVEVVTRDGQLFGTIDRVARDHCDLALHPPATPRRAANVSGTALVAFANILYLRL